MCESNSLLWAAYTWHEWLAMGLAMGLAIGVVLLLGLLQVIAAVRLYKIFSEPPEVKH